MKNEKKTPRHAAAPCMYGCKAEIRTYTVYTTSDILSLVARKTQNVRERENDTRFSPHPLYTPISCI